ncbi:IspD/TarI family cytidylyltransferase [Lederbergia lenta]|uniref:2-C-methyl-D-erythritol 4-phosphate cytidylyltransferase n=1 Tax=Lederbergia lenta TaxID=1467 RepID=A0A2X4ZR94_LEDLE|nr:IspD/TarI family cytidylyltransferase [Lederbergia lenta]MCM3112002.1 2-C-methyl-D-erythritol 4-phosphate cytidylyltransferase [Lederbergia lenta]MEC2323174.1 IspD/TarI family cytidylyltransferase [Lederbergia lenta]SQI62884.1 2-C-methyl-D-erythritol 4-phosphate cytidylyltransferase [Lederbergia lenta]
MKGYSLILLSGGIGKRMQLNIPKQFLLLAGKPIFIHVLEKVDLIKEIREIIIPCPVEFMVKTREIIDDYGFSTPIRCIEGGTTRQESVYKGLKEAAFENVIIHEAVRPFVSSEEYEALIHTNNESVIFGLDIPFTVLRGNETVEGILERDQLINVQLPHKFHTKKLLYAHECAREDGREFTEDASLYFYYYQSDIEVLQGSEYNIKITKPVDRKIAEVIYKESIYMEG